MSTSQISAIQSTVKPADLPIEQLAGNTHLSDSEKIGELARQFEALLLRQILQAGRKTVIHSKYSDGSAGSEIYQDMVTEKLADGISRNGSLGLARSLQVQLQRQNPPGGADLSKNGTGVARESKDVSKGRND